MAIRVCIFEDNPKMNKALAQLVDSASGLELAGTFTDGKDVLRNVTQSDPDVVLMDIDMPEVNGIEAVKMIRKHFPKLRILMQTVFEDDDKVFESLVAGASGYVLKNMPSDKMVEAIVEVHNGGAPMSPSIASRVLNLFQHYVRKPEKETEEYNLSQREKEVLSCMVDGKPYKVICDELSITYSTVRSHVQKIYEKLHVSNNTEAVSKALKQKLVSLLLPLLALSKVLWK